MMVIRRAVVQDIAQINKLLYQVHRVHAQGRPDLFALGNKKYTDEQLEVLLQDDERPVFAAEKDGEILGYAFCVFQRYEKDPMMTDITSLYIDDLCVDEEQRGQHIGQKLYQYVLDFAKEQGCYHVTLNVWCCNEGAMKFYEKCGLKPLKIGMEQIL